MEIDWKAIWNKLKADLKDSSSPRTPEELARISAAMVPIYELQKAFETERNHQPFVSRAPCPICGIGTVTYTYRAPLIGEMKCDTSECIAINL